MPISTEILYASIDELFLDPTNPRLGRHVASPDLSPERVLEAMQSWDLEELAVSFLQSGFWPQEAVIVIREQLYGARRLVVLEGNRRIAALKTLEQAYEGTKTRRAWLSITGASPKPDTLFARIPYLLVTDRSDVDEYLGFRHVTGIKQWRPAEKAQYITRLIDERGMSFRDVTRAIGSKVDAVRRNYLAFKTIEQIEALDSEIQPSDLEGRFSVLFLALRQPTIRNFIGVDVTGETETMQSPVPPSHEENLIDFSVWLFGTESREPVLDDSRRMGEFARVIGSDKAVDYLRTARSPSLDTALRYAGVDTEDVIVHIRTATEEVESALTRIHLVREEADVQTAVRRFEKSANELLVRAAGTAPAEA